MDLFRPGSACDFEAGEVLVGRSALGRRPPIVFDICVATNTAGSRVLRARSDGSIPVNFSACEGAEHLHSRKLASYAPAMVLPPDGVARCSGASAPQWVFPCFDQLGGASAGWLKRFRSISHRLPSASGSRLAWEQQFGLALARSYGISSRACSLTLPKRSARDVAAVRAAGPA